MYLIVCTVQAQDAKYINTQPPSSIIIIIHLPESIYLLEVPLPSPKPLQASLKELCGVPSCSLSLRCQRRTVLRRVDATLGVLSLTARLRAARVLFDGGAS